MFCAISNVERRNNIDFVAAVGVSENVVILDDGGNFIRLDRELDTTFRSTST